MPALSKNGQTRASGLSCSTLAHFYIFEIGQDPQPGSAVSYSSLVYEKRIHFLHALRHCISGQRADPAGACKPSPEHLSMD